MKKILLFLFFVMSCSTFKVSTLNYDPIYGPDNNEIKVNVLNNDWEVFRKFRIDDNFRYDYSQFVINQPYSWYASNRMVNRWAMYSPYTTFDFYFNRHSFWNNWAFNYNWGSWNYPYWGRWNRISNHRPYYNQFRIYNNNRRDRNIAYSATPRGSKSIRHSSPVDVIVRDLRKNGKDVRVINNSSELIRINQPRRTYTTPRSSTAGPTTNYNQGRNINNNPRVRSTPNVIQRSNSGGSRGGSKSGNNGRSGGKPIQ